MESKILEIKEMYKEGLEKKKELKKLLNIKSVNRYIEVMDYKKPVIESDEEIMSKILSKMDIPTEYGLYINNGLFYSRVEMRYITYLKKEYLIKISDIDREPLSSDGELISRLNNHFYSLENGKISNDASKEKDIIINLPGFSEKLKLLEPFTGDYDNPDRDYNPGKQNRILRAQFFMELMDKNVDDVINYYADSSNWQNIEDRVNNYLSKEKVLKK